MRDVKRHAIQPTTMNSPRFWHLTFTHRPDCRANKVRRTSRERRNATWSQFGRKNFAERSGNVVQSGGNARVSKDRSTPLNSRF